jgi:hypothetical protein
MKKNELQFVIMVVGIAAEPLAEPLAELAVGVTSDPRPNDDG